MIKHPIYKYALANGLLTALYVVFVGLFISNAGTIFGHGPDNALIPMAMLLLFIFSALVCGGLVLGRPILWYMDGKKKEALTLLAYTTLVIFVVMVLMFLVLFIISTM